MNLKKHIGIVGTFLVAGILGIIALHSPFAFAATATPTPSTSTSSTQTKTASPSADPAVVKQNTLDRIEKILDEKGSSILNSLKRKAYVGQVVRVTTESLTVNTLHGEVTVKLTPGKTAMFLIPRLTPVQISDIEIDGFVIAMGYVDGDDVLDARRVLVSPSPLFPIKKGVILGVVQSIKSTQVLVRTLAQEDKVVLVSSKTVYQDSTGTTIKKTDVKANTKILIITPNADDASTSASLVRVMQ